MKAKVFALSILITFYCSNKLSCQTTNAYNEIQRAIVEYEKGNRSIAATLFANYKDSGMMSGESNQVYGEMWLNGWGVSKNYYEAVKYFKRSAAQDYAPGMCYLAYMYISGTGVEKDRAEAERWYRKASDKGSIYAMESLGDLYLSGQGGTKDYKEALYWYRKGAALNSGCSLFKIGLIYENGYGVNQNINEALKYYRLCSKKISGYEENALEKIKRLSVNKH